MFSHKRFTLIQSVIVLGCVACFAIPAYVAFNKPASAAVAQTNLQSAATAAVMYARRTGLYSSINGKRLRRVLPGLDRQLGAVAVNDDNGFCLEEGVNGQVYDYVGGEPGTALATGFQAWVTQPGPCSAAVGAAAV
jgi:hypothetical protein